jgi:hypothetical protein
MLEDALALANTLARGELLVALRAPQIKLIGLLRARSEDLEDSDELEEFADDIAQTNWGAW